MEKYAQRKILFWDTKWLLGNMPYRGRDDRAVWGCVIGRTTWPLHCQLTPWKSNEVLFVFCGPRVWNFLKSIEEWRVSMETVVLSQGRVYEWVERFQNRQQNISDEHRSGRPVSVATETVKQQIEQWIRDYRRVTIDEIAVEFNMSHGSPYILSIMTSGIGKCIADG
jgi:hypothetical protein